MSNNMPANVAPNVLPVERRLPQPSPDATTIVRLVTDPLDRLPSDGDKKREPNVWILNQAHPLAGEAKIVRMYLREDEGVEVYSSDGKMFVRTVLPARVVRFFDEVMGEETFVAFIAEAEAEEEDEEPDEPDEPADPDAAAAPSSATNGSAPAS
jgi:hypothetical protein